MTELVIADGWFVSEIINNSESSFMDSINCHFQQSRWSLVQAVSCKCFPSQEALLCAVLARAHTAYSSILAVQVRVVGCIYAPYKVNPNIFQFYFDFPDIFHHISMHPLFRNIYEFYPIFYDFISPSIINLNHL